MRGAVSILLAGLVACGSGAVQTAPRPPGPVSATPTAAPAPSTAPLDDVEREPPEPPPALVVAGTTLAPGDRAMIDGEGVFTLVEIKRDGGQEVAVFRRGPGGEVLGVALANADDFLRLLVSPAEAEQRRALLLDPTPARDDRPAATRRAERQAIIEDGTDADRLAWLRRSYASHHALTRAEKKAVDRLEGLLVDELAEVRGVEPAAQRAELRAAHALRGAFRPGAPARRGEDPRDPRDPFGYPGFSYHGRFALHGDTLVLGDRVYTGSPHDGAEVDRAPNLRLPARSGRWHCYVELDPDRPDDTVEALVIVHDAIATRPAPAVAGLARAGSLWVDTGSMQALDAAVRDDPALHDVVHEASREGILAGRGCMSWSFGGDGNFATYVHTDGGVADLVLVDFADRSRALLLDLGLGR